MNDKQYAEGLHCACKIKNRHVNFHNEKMKVFLASQVLSSSASAALNYLEYELKDSEFKKASPTSKFLKNCNDIFDLLNTKNMLCKTPGKMSITEKSLPELKTKINEYISYTEKLEIDVKVKVKISKLEQSNKENNLSNQPQYYYKSIRKPVLESSSVRTGFLGFIICLRNLYTLCENLLTAKIVKYFLSYKLSQDHVEMFFALIRRMNGCNNNPDRKSVV